MLRLTFFYYALNYISKLQTFLFLFYFNIYWNIKETFTTIQKFGVDKNVKTFSWFCDQYNFCIMSIMLKTVVLVNIFVETDTLINKVQKKSIDMKL